MPDLWFLAGLAMGICVTGFCAVGSFDRGVDSVRRKVWKRELSARRSAERNPRERAFAAAPAQQDRLAAS